MRSIIEWFVRYPIFANLIILAICVFGLLGYSNVKMSFFPERDQRNISISVAYPGASPVEVEEGITYKIEESLKSVVGIEEINSTSSENIASISITTLENYDIDEILTEVKNAVDRINSYPESAEKPVVFKQKPIDRAIFISLSGDVDLMTLKKTAEIIEDDFLNSGLISQVSLTGFPNLEISIEVSESNLLRYGLTFDEVAAAVRMNNRDISGGSIKTVNEEIRIRANAKQFDPSLIGEIILRANNDGSRILLRDVATLNMQFADVPNKFFVNNKASVSILVSKLPEEDLQEISVFVNDYVKEFNATTENMQLSVTFDFLSMLMQRLDLLTSNGGLGLILVLISLGFFLSLRLSFWVALGIPISFLGMFILGNMYGITINMLSLFGMILVIGILVDDGIVIGENIYTHFEKGKSPKKAAVDGTMEVLPAVFTSVMTTIVAFIPLMLLDNDGRTKEMSVVVIGCLLFSLVEAFFILPAHLANPKVLSRREKENSYTRVRAKIEGGITLVRKVIYRKALNWLIKWRWLAVSFPVIFLMLIFGMFKGGIIASTIFPTIPFDRLNINIAFKPGTRENITQEYLEKFERQVWEVNEELRRARNEDDSLIQFTSINLGSSFDGDESGGHAGNVSISFSNLEKKDISSLSIADSIRKKIGIIREAEKFSVGGSNRFGTPISIALTGTELDDLNEAKNLLQEELKGFPQLKDIKDNSAVGMRELEIELKPLAYFLGFTHNDITRQIRQGFFGEEVQRLQIGSDEVRVWVRYPIEDRLRISQMESMKIKGPNNQEFPLIELANYTIKRGVININHFNGKREVRIEGDLVDPYESLPPIIEKIEKEVLPPILAKYPNISYTMEGQNRRREKELSSMLKVYPIFFGIMILLIVFAFRSFYQASLILMLIPIGIACAVIGHWFHSVPVSMLSLNGMIALTGIIINDAVVMLDKYNRNLKEGMRYVEAAREAGVARFRAIMLTSITTVVGLYPIILEKSFQAQFLIPMGISVAYGVLFGTIFILLFFPILILVSNDVKVYVNWFFRSLIAVFTGKEPVKPTHEEVEPAVKELKNEAEVI